MNVEMLPVEIVGLKNDLNPVIYTLRKQGCVHIDEVNNSPQISARPLALDRKTLSHQEELSFLLAQIDGLLEVLGCGDAGKVVPLPEGNLVEVRSCLGELGPKVSRLD